MRAIWSRVDTDVEKVVAEELKELLRGLQGGSLDAPLRPVTVKIQSCTDHWSIGLSDTVSRSDLAEQVS